MCEPTESAKHSPQPDALHHITTHINTIIYSVRYCFAIEHPWPEGWRRDGCASAPELFHEGKGRPRKCSGAPRICPGRSRDRRPEGKRVCAGTAWRISGTACPRPRARRGGTTTPCLACAPSDVSGELLPRVPFTAGARAFRFTLPAPRDTRLGARGADMR